MVGELPNPLPLGQKLNAGGDIATVETFIMTTSWLAFSLLLSDILGE